MFMFDDDEFDDDEIAEKLLKEEANVYSTLTVVTALTLIFAYPRFQESVKKLAGEIAAEIKRANRAVTVDESLIYREIALLKIFSGRPYRDHQYKEANKKYAKSVVKCVKELQRLLKGQPNAVDPLYFFASIPGGPKKGNPVPRMESFRDHLTGILEVAQWIIDNEIGKHGGYGHEQIRAADTAAELMIAHNLPLAYSSEISTYRYIAQLLYGADIRRACETVARRRSQHRNRKK